MGNPVGLTETQQGSMTQILLSLKTLEREWEKRKGAAACYGMLHYAQAMIWMMQSKSFSTLGMAVLA